MFMIQQILDIIFPPKRDALVVRTLSVDDILEHLYPTNVNGAIALLPYRVRAIGALVREAKFNGSVRAWELLAVTLSEYLLEYLGDQHAYEERVVVLVPIPLSKKRYRERGYNQVEEVLKRVSVPDVRTMPRALKRVRHTKAQTSLTKRSRMENLAGAFYAEAADPTYLYMVIDDVTTTGATLHDAVRALTETGALHVHAVALSH
ncbi:MAG TPA: hypothetical protein VEA92_03555 [Candidatus Paceibacterota bacterium]|nr:hypothetical protein [Candidatus Paceibacterota bacterium]